VEIDSYYFRPTEVDSLRGDSSKACKNLGWKPKIGFQDLVRIMTEYDLNWQSAKPMRYNSAKIEKKVLAASLKPISRF